jgi:hypothetical protein
MSTMMTEAIQERSDLALAIFGTTTGSRDVWTRPVRSHPSRRPARTGRTALEIDRDVRCGRNVPSTHALVRCGRRTAAPVVSSGVLRALGGDGTGANAEVGV